MLELLAQVAEPSHVRNTLDSLARTPISQVVILVAACTVLRLALFPYLSKTPPHMRSGGYSAARIFNEFLDAIIYAGVFVFLVIRPFGVQTFVIPSGSMLDTLQLNDYIVANKAVYRYSDPQFGDIIVFKPPQAAKKPQDGDVDIDYIKRCRGVPGDLIEIKNGEFYRNGQKVNEPFVKHMYGGDKMMFDFRLVKYKGEYWPLTIYGNQVNADEIHTASKFVPKTVEEAEELLSLPAEKIPAGHYLMIGDNREGSFDSRAWGLVPRDSIIGKSMFIWWPPNRWQATR